MRYVLKFGLALVSTVLLFALTYDTLAKNTTYVVILLLLAIALVSWRRLIGLPRLIITTQFHSIVDGVLVFRNIQSPTMVKDLHLELPTFLSLLLATAKCRLGSPIVPLSWQTNHEHKDATIHFLQIPTGWRAGHSPRPLVAYIVMETLLRDSVSPTKARHTGIWDNLLQWLSAARHLIAMDTSGLFNLKYRVMIFYVDDLERLASQEYALALRVENPSHWFRVTTAHFIAKQFVIERDSSTPAFTIPIDISLPEAGTALWNGTEFAMPITSMELDEIAQAANN